MLEYKWMLEVVGGNLRWTSSSFKSNSKISTCTCKLLQQQHYHKGAISRIGLQMYWSMDPVVTYIPRYKEEKEITDETSS